MRLLILLFLLIAATACGKTGDLYIPDQNTAQADTRSE
jgi:predicted small lipoprotein YifL